MLRRVHLIDGNNLFHRGYFIARSMQRDALGFILEMVGNIKRMEPSSRPVFAFDTTKSERRLALYPEYKAKRKSSMNEEEYAAFRRIYESFIDIIRKSGCTVLCGHGYEADDFIACFTRMLKPDYRVVIVSSDSDLYQLISSNVTVYDPIKGIHLTLDNFDNVTGIPFGHFLDFKCMVGDKSDNIPGFPGIAEKIAEQYISAYGDYNAIHAALTEKGPLNLKKREQVLLDRDTYEFTRQLVDLSLCFSDPKLRAIIKDSVASTVSDHKVLYDHLGSCDMTQYFALLKSLAATNV